MGAGWGGRLAGAHLSSLGWLGALVTSGQYFYNDSMKWIFLFLETCDITQVDLKLVILLLQPPEHWDCRLGTQVL